MDAIKVNTVPGLECIIQHCNLDLMGHLGTFIEWIARLDAAFNTTKLKKYSVWCASGVCPHSPYIFGAACQALIQVQRKLHKSHCQYF